MARYAVVSTSAKRLKRRKLRRRLACVVVAVLAVALLVAVRVYRRSLTPTILDIAQTRLKSETTAAVNEAVCAALADVSLSELVSVQRNDRNEIEMITANSAMVNMLARRTAQLSQNKINSLKNFDVCIPVGTLSGIPLLSERGKTVSVAVSPIGTVVCTFTSYFESAGINQTLHRIYINVESTVDLIMPTLHTHVETSTPVLISESLIVGAVPQVFLQGGLLLGAS